MIGALTLALIGEGAANAGPAGVADYDGDGRTDMTYWRPSSGMWYVRTSRSNWDADFSRLWGTDGDIPLNDTDFDGDGDLDVVSLNNGWNRFTIWRQGAGGLSSAFETHPHSATQHPPDDGLALADVNGDGAVDVVSGATYGPLSVSYNATTNRGPIASAGCSSRAASSEDVTSSYSSAMTSVSRSSRLST